MNKLTRKQHLMICLAEECSEVVQAVSKSLRFGHDETSPDGETNAEKIRLEITDVAAVIMMLLDAGVLRRMEGMEYDERIQEKQAKVEKYMKQYGIV